MAEEKINADAVGDTILAARAILECYIETIPNERAEDRYVLWAVRDKLDAAHKALDL